jgi:hypothetical protein
MTTVSRLLRRTATTGAATVLAAVLAAGASSAATEPPYPGFPPIPPSKPDAGHSADADLRRVGEQLVRGDYLTGAGVSAPPWIPSMF